MTPRRPQAHPSPPSRDLTLEEYATLKLGLRTIMSAVKRRVQDQYWRQEVDEKLKSDPDYSAAKALLDKLTPGPTETE